MITSTNHVIAKPDLHRARPHGTLGIFARFSCQVQVKSKIKYHYLSAGPCTVPCIGVARIFDWGGPNHKSHAMTSSKIFKKGTCCGAKISYNRRSEAVARWHLTRILVKGEGRKIIVRKSKRLT